MPPLASRLAFRQEATTPENLAATCEERLRSLAAAILDKALAADAVGLMRVTVAEARRFPDLATSVHQTARDRGLEFIAQLLGEFANSDALGASGPAGGDHPPLPGAGPAADHANLAVFEENFFET